MSVRLFPDKCGFSVFQNVPWVHTVKTAALIATVKIVQAVMQRQENVSVLMAGVAQDVPTVSYTALYYPLTPHFTPLHLTSTHPTHPPYPPTQC